MSQDMLTEAHESLDHFLDVRAGIDCRMVPTARRNLARLVEGLQDQRQEIAAMRVALDAAKAAPQSTELLEAVTKLTESLEEDSKPPETSLDQIRGDLDALDPIVVQEHVAAMAKLESRRDIMMAMAPGFMHTATAVVCLILGGIVGVMI